MGDFMGKRMQPLIMVLAAVTVPASTSAAPPVVSTLVRAKVKSVEAKSGGKVEIALLEIIHVYRGASELKGQTFHDVYRAATTSGLEAVSPFQVDEEGIWTLVLNPKDELWPEHDPLFPFRSRSRKVDNPRHAQNVQLAEAIEKVERAKPKERATVLISLAADQTPEVAAWAVRTLGTSDDPTAAKFLDGFAEKPDAKLPLLAQLALDEVLSKTKREEWFWAKARTELLRSWVSGKVDEYHSMRVLQRLDLSDQRAEIRNVTAVEMVRLAAENKDWPWKARRHAIFLVGMLGGRVVDDAAAFEWLFEQIKTSKDDEVREAAALSVRNYLPLPPARLKVVEGHLVFCPGYLFG